MPAITKEKENASLDLRHTITRYRISKKKPEKTILMEIFSDYHECVKGLVEVKPWRTPWRRG